MLIIVSSTKPSKLHPILSPLLEHCGAQCVVVHPEDKDLAKYFLPENTILLMGAKAFSLLTDTGILKKKQKLGGVRERIFKPNNIPTMVTYDVNLTEFMPAIMKDIQWDVRLAVRYALTGTLRPVVGHYQYVDDLEPVVNALITPEEGRAQLEFDTETIGLDEFAPDGRIITLQFTVKEGESYVWRVPEDGQLPSKVKAQLWWLFNQDWINTIGANLKYDMRWVYTHWKLEITNHRFDTQLVGGLLDENRYNSLKAHCKEYAPELGGYEIEFEAKHDKSKMHLALAADPEGFLVYAGGDTDAVSRVYPRLKTELCKDLQLARFYARLLQPASVAFQKLESRGICIDKPRYLELQVEATKELQEQSDTCFSMISNHIKYKYKDNLKLTRDVIVREHLFGPYGLGLKPVMYTDGSEKLMAAGKPPQESTAWEHLKMFIDHPEAGPFVKKLKEYNATAKTLSTYIVGFLAHLRSDGRFHPSYVLAKGGQGGDEDEGGGTLTGRSSCKDPAYQTWPKRTAWAKRLRSVVVPPSGYIVVKFDFSQGELRIMADAANCKIMIEAYHQGLDLHAITAANMMGLTLEQFMALPEDQREMGRYLAKACFSPDTEVLTPEGWVAFDVLKKGTLVAQYEEGELVFVEPLDYQQFENREVWHCQDRHTDLLITPDHRQPLVDRHGNWHDDRLEEYQDWQLGAWSVAHAGEMPTEGGWSEGFTKLVVMTQADGSYGEFGTLRFGFKKGRKILRCREILKANAVNFTESVQSNGVTCFYVSRLEVERLALKEIMPDKKFTNQVWQQVHAEAFLEEIRHWDGRFDPSGKDLQQYFSEHKSNVDIVQLVAVTSGRTCTIRQQGKYWSASYRKEKKSVNRISWGENGIKKKVIPVVHCLSVPSTYLLVRRNGKVTVSGNCNFGLIYRISPAGLMGYAAASYGYLMTLQEAEKYHSKWFEPYPEIITYHDTQVSTARRQGYVRNQLGRIRHTPMIHSRDNQLRGQAERQAINSPTQGCLFDMMMLAMVGIARERPDIWMFGNTHDSLELYLKEDTWQEDAKQIKQIMENLPLQEFGWTPKVPFTVDCEMSAKNMAELKKVKLA